MREVNGIPGIYIYVEMYTRKLASLEIGGSQTYLNLIEN